jgi:16S rRNA (cytosine1402-N4)-methyltransferase
MINYSYHVPVLTDEVVDYIRPKSDGVYVDCTVGGGGHSFKMLTHTPGIKLVCFDRDTDAIEQASKTLNKFEKQVIFVKDNFSNIKSGLALLKINKVDGILMDIGVSTHQILEKDRGFSFTVSGKLDMRMDRNAEMSAIEIINTYDFQKLTQIFFDYGQENNSRMIAQSIIAHREVSQIETTEELSDIISKCLTRIPSKSLIKIKARIFQAIRIEVNNELNNLTKALPDAVSLLKPNGRLIVICFHSLEDRIVKDYFKNLVGSCDCPRDLPVCRCQKISKFKILTKKPVVPSQAEIQSNLNARSAKLRVIEKIDGRE